MSDLKGLGLSQRQKRYKIDRYKKMPEMAAAFFK
tara:strand:- start:40 stop:141 length:102 start_codon:yes stop_codon:yes gene_type:complete